MVDIPAAVGASVIRTQLDVAPSISYREQGNDEYRRGNYLRAAALYTKALKDDPECAALYSNRSAALLHVNKLSKALTDADQCIRLEPEWDKGHYRRGAALEALDRLEEALTSYRKAAEIAGDSSRTANDKVRNLQKLLRQRTRKHGDAGEVHTEGARLVAG